LDALFRAEWGRVLATLVRVTGDFQLAEEVTQEAFAAAWQQWPHAGVPDQPRAWLTRTARNKAIDRIRRRANFRVKQDQLRDLVPSQVAPPSAEALMDQHIPDDRLRLVFTCCHPALKMEARVALTLRALGGLTTEEIARAFLVPKPTMAQRLVRAQQKITNAGIPYAVPPPEQLPERVAGVCAVVYLVFNEGYSATGGQQLVRGELCDEALSLGRVLAALLPEDPRVLGLLALMLLHDSRRAARLDSAGDIVLLEHQDRALWDRDRIGEGLELTERSLHAGTTTYGIQAAITAVHARSASYADTAWDEIAALYTVLLERQPSPIVALNRAVAVAMATDATQGLLLLDGLAATGTLATHHLLPAARGDMLRRLGRWRDAAAAFGRALALVRTDPERRFLQRRLIEAQQRAGGTDPTPNG